MTADYSAVLTALHPDATWGMVNDDLTTLRWDESNATPKPTKKSLDDAWPDVKAARDAKAPLPTAEQRLAALEARLDRAAATEVAGDAAKVRDAMKETP